MEQERLTETQPGHGAHGVAAAHRKPTQHQAAVADIEAAEGNRSRRAGLRERASRGRGKQQQPQQYDLSTHGTLARSQSIRGAIHAALLAAAAPYPGQLSRQMP